MRPPQWILRTVARRFERAQERAHADVARVQEQQLLRILARYRDTELGAMLGLSAVRSGADFRRLVAPRTASDYQALWNRAIDPNGPGIVHPKRIAFAANSSGTSGGMKLIPFPEEQFQNFRTFTNHAFFHAFHALDDYSLLGANVLITAAPPIREVTSTGVTVGFSSGLATLKSPRFARSVLRPSPEVLALPDFDDKIRAMAAESVALDIRVLTGMPNAVVPLLEQVLAEARTRGGSPRTVRDVWPNLKLYFYSGCAIAPFEARLRALFGPDVPFYEVYSSSEAPVAFQHRFDRPGLLVDVLTVVLELAPVGAPAGTPRIPLHEADVGGLYDVVVTSPGGILAYALGDRIEVLSKDPYVIRFAGRDREEINLGGEHLGLATLRQAVDEGARALGRSAFQFFVCPAAPSGTGAAAHEFVIELDDTSVSTDALARALDGYLQSSNGVYATVRRGDMMIGMPRVVLLPRGSLERFVLANRAFGQGKVVNVFHDRAVPEQILAFARGHAEPAS